MVGSRSKERVDFAVSNIWILLPDLRGSQKAMRSFPVNLFLRVFSNMEQKSLCLHFSSISAIEGINYKILYNFIRHTRFQEG